MDENSNKSIGCFEDEVGGVEWDFEKQAWHAGDSQYSSDIIIICGLYHNHVIHLM